MFAEGRLQGENFWGRLADVQILPDGSLLVSDNWRLAKLVRVDKVAGPRYIGSVIVAESNGRCHKSALGRNHLPGVTARLAF